jgi:phospholipid/cholesterol/gamma-HCH transport system substrate-binding protein
MSTIPRDSGRREVRVGIFVLAGLISFVWILFMMTDPATLRGRYMVVTVLENAGGVRKGDPIQLRGVNVGRVHRFEMLSRGEVAITMELEDEWQVPMGSEVRLGAAGIFGGRTMEIVPGSAQGFLQDYDTIPGVGADPGGLMGSLEGAAASGDVARAVARADTAMAVLAETGANLDRATASLRSLLERIDRGEGTLGRLALDDALYTNLNQAAASLAELVADVQENPRRYINLSIF